MEHIKEYHHFISDYSDIQYNILEEGYDVNKINNNIKEIVKVIKSTGLKDNNAILGLLSVIGKESGFSPVRETTKNLPDNESWLRKKFPGLTGYVGSAVGLKKNREKAFYNTVYGADTKTGKALGNTEDSDGYNYRGGGYTQLTGKKYYQAMGIKDPKEIETPAGAAKALKNSIVSYVGKTPGSLKFKTAEEGVKYFVNKVRGSSSDFKTQYDKAIKALNTFLKKGNKYTIPQ